MNQQTDKDYFIDVHGNISERTITIIVDDAGKELARSYHRRMITSDSDMTEEDRFIQDLMGVIKYKGDHGELDEIQAGLDDADVVSEGETVDGEAAKKLTFMERLRSWFARPADRG